MLADAMKKNVKVQKVMHEIYTCVKYLLSLLKKFSDSFSRALKHFVNDPI